ncbi:phosphoadenosine phosphosulfate reductase [Streptomyces sp. V4I2]|uniref:phosphoadenosine phosphosulfate reductase n=1 Tax=Streptomyces sp. V4I2 TaxID=3042280 RepID=UPI00278991A4|nr:phosphoadenosine phosphosulfate reductase [Streptomyces sp. V4I2]MDQ1051780.1 3'-phosphoadenosine 5'-phosphosulfate sulfotransferase (PAPS reductase)/FAD synthetase [Streptomyces sp. V4I2]
MPSHSANRPSSTPDLTSYDRLAPQLSGGKDSAVMMAVFMDAARTAGVDDRVISYHASLGVLEWPPVVFDGIRYPGVSELAAMQSAAFGVPDARHVEVTRTMPGPDGTRMPHSLLTEIAAYGRFPRMGSPYCRKAAKESVVSSAWTPIVSRLKRELGRPVRILKVMGLRSDEGPDRKKRPAFRTVQANSARIVDEWLPVKDWSTDAVKEWHTDAPVPYSWTYDSVPGAGDWSGTSRCSCSLCVFASRRDLLLASGRRPRLAELYAEVERVRGDSFRADWRISDLIRHARTCGAPDPGVVCADDGPDFAALQAQVRGALKLEPRKEPDLARKRGRALCGDCAVQQ